MLEEGQVIRLKQVVIMGPILDIRYNKEEKSLEYLMSWAGDEGQPHQRWFPENKIELVEEE